MEHPPPPPKSDEEQELLERLRDVDLRLDREGRWWHEGSFVEHLRLARALHRWLDQLPDGRYIVRIDSQRFVYVKVDDAPYVVRTIRVDDTGQASRIFLHLSDETEEELDYSSLTVGPDDALYGRVKGRFNARFSRQAQHLIGELIAEAHGGFVLRAAGKQWKIE